MQKIGRDLERFHKIVRGKVETNLGKYISRGEMIGRKGNDKVSIPLPQIQLPQFRYGEKGSGGVGQGDGNPGDPLTAPKGDGTEGPGDQAGQHILEVEFTMEELAEMLRKRYNLPRLEPKDNGALKQESNKYTAIAPVGPQGLRHTKRTFFRNLRRQIGSGTYNPANPILIPERGDFLYKASKPVIKPDTKAMVGYMMDVSGSMSDEMKEIARITAFWIETMLRGTYAKGSIYPVHIIHDSEAKVVDSDTFYNTREDGGTKISSVFDLFGRICRGEQEIELEGLGKIKINPAEWNLYGFYFGDGDNYQNDNKLALSKVKELLEILNLLAYTEIESPYGHGDDTFLAEIGDSDVDNHEKFRSTSVQTKDGIESVIKAIFEARQSMVGSGI